MTSAFNTTLILALFALAALRPPMPRHSSPFNLQFALGWWINEVPIVGLWWLAAATVGTLANPQPGVWWILVAALTAVDAALFARLAIRARSARPALAEAFETHLGAGSAPAFTRPPWWRLVVPIVSWRPDVRRIRSRRYGPARRGHRIDLYVSRRAQGMRHHRPGGAPVLVYFHGSFAFGSKMLGSRAMLYRLAADGWVCASAGRRLFRAGYRDQLDDVRASLTWLREHAAEFGGDPDAIFAAGGSAGANLAATAAMSGSDVAGVVGLYGYYGSVGRGPGPTSPAQVIHPDAPPFLIVHGSSDTLVLHREARAFAHRLDAISRRPVIYAELPGAQHNFDFFQSLRAHAVTDAVARFAELTRASRTDRRLENAPSAATNWQENGSDSP